MAGAVDLHLRQRKEVGLLGFTGAASRGWEGKVIAVRRAACHGLDSGSILELVRVMA
jgi:hypothetical protein